MDMVTLGQSDASVVLDHMELVSKVIEDLTEEEGMERSVVFILVGQSHPHLIKIKHQIGRW